MEGEVDKGPEVVEPGREVHVGVRNAVEVEHVEEVLD